LLRLSEGKLKGKVEDLKAQLNDYLDRLKQRQQESEDRESEIFRLRKQNEELAAVNQKLSMAVKGVNGEKVDERRLWEAKEREMKILLNNYLLEKKKLEAQLEDREGETEEILIKQRFLEQENERMNRELVRWKERYEWLEREKEARIK
jgi:chromosome segregation ATPase